MKAPDVFLASFLGVFAAIFVLDYLSFLNNQPLLKMFVFGIVVFSFVIILMLREKRQNE